MDAVTKVKALAKLDNMFMQVGRPDTWYKSTCLTSTKVLYWYKSTRRTRCLCSSCVCVCVCACHEFVVPLRQASPEDGCVCVSV